MELEQKRLRLDELLSAQPGCKEAYYSPPDGLEMKYPCITYNLMGDNKRFADNIPYFRSLQWVVTVIDEDPDSRLANVFFNMPRCIFDRKYSASGLNHFVFTLTY